MACSFGNQVGYEQFIIPIRRHAALFDFQQNLAAHAAMGEHVPVFPPYATVQSFRTVRYTFSEVSYQCSGNSPRKGRSRSNRTSIRSHVVPCTRVARLAAQSMISRLAVSMSRNEYPRQKFSRT